MNKACLYQKQRGLSYIEVLVASFLLAISLVPALEALQPGIQGSVIHKHYSEDHYQLIAKMEEVLAESFSNLQAVATATGSPDITTSYSDIFTFPDGRQITRSVFLSAYDADNADGDNNSFTGTESDLIWVKVLIEGTPHELETLTKL